MLKKLHISNYALIDQLSFEPSQKLSTITGETGAGKSIILGALGLLLGKRSEGTDLFNPKSKCIIEGWFDSSKKNIKDFLNQNDFDVEDVVIIRREILASGKTRAFVNDTPSKLTVINKLGELLINIHSQHGHLELKKPSYILKVLDSFCGLTKLASTYSQVFQKRSKLIREIDSIKAEQEKQLLDFDYLSFLYKELEELNPLEGELNSLETELAQLQHGEEIQTAISDSISAFDEEGGAVLNAILKVEQIVSNVSEYSSQLSDLLKRVKESRLELEDINTELVALNADVEYNPERIEVCTNRVNAYNHLLHKHHLTSDKDLIEKKEELKLNISSVKNIDDTLEKLNGLVDSLTQEIVEKGELLSSKRKEGAEQLTTKIEEMLNDLGIKNGVVKFDFKFLEEAKSLGFDEVLLLFSANKGKSPKEVTTVASGGELSRIMLSLKSILAEKESLPSIVFDEIDSGVSGEVANQMGLIMQKMAKTMQVVSITHLPQIAAKGNQHFTVEKHISNEKTETNIRELTGEHRIIELAKMLSGDKISGVAKENARILLDN